MQTVPNFPFRNTQLESDDVGLSHASLQQSILQYLWSMQGKVPETATPQDYYLAAAYTVRDRLLHRWLRTNQTYRETSVRSVAYLSAEYLLGPQLAHNLLNLGIYSAMEQAVQDLGLAVQDLGLNLETLLEQEKEPNLGSGGLGRLAACYLDSLATLEVPAIGYGIRYEPGIFDQEIQDGWQLEATAGRLETVHPWEMARPEWSVEVKLGGHTERYTDERGELRTQWQPRLLVRGIPYDMPILGYQTETVNTLRLWAAAIARSAQLSSNPQVMWGELEQETFVENLTGIFYAGSGTPHEKPLRMLQQYFFVSCCLQDLIRLHLQQGGSPQTLHLGFTVHLNEAPPAIAVAELMRLLLDEHNLPWETAWEITRSALSYTHHTLSPQVLGRWPLEVFQEWLPRHLEIIYEINQRFLEQVRLQFPNDEERVRRMSLIDETGDRYVRIANLACMGSHTINGVTDLHLELLKQGILKDFHEFAPEQFSSKTNGVNPRRFILLSNPRLAALITRKIGDRWLKHLEELRQLEAFVEDPEFRREWRQVKQAAKQDLAHYIQTHTGIEVNPNSIFDIQAKRFHEYKRQHLNILHIITLYNRIKANPDLEITPRTFIFAGKADPKRFLDKLMVKLVNAVAAVINADPEVKGQIKVVFLKNFNLKLAQRIYPAADVSEQISLVTREASGTGNMKFAMNGALTIGTLDGANIEIREEVGADNFFVFGLTREEVYALTSGRYNPWLYYHNSPTLKGAIDLIASGHFSPDHPGLFQPLVDLLMSQDGCLALADYQFYINAQEQVSQTFCNPDEWTRKSILNVARIGKFSSDRAVREYCQDIWKVQPLSAAV